MPTTRRDFLISGMLGLTGASLPQFGASMMAADPLAYPIIDTHTHFYDPTRPQGIPWPPKDDRLLYRPVLPKEFKDLAKPFGVKGTVIVEASPWVEDNQWLLDQAADDPFVLGIVGNLSPGSDLFAAQLSRFAKNPIFRGIRVGSDDIEQRLDRTAFIADLNRLIDADLELDVNGGPPMLGIVDRLASRLPKLRIVINHLANVRIDGKKPPELWLDGLKASADHERVFLKVSGYVDNARINGGKAPEETAFYLPVLNAAWDSFGENRLIFGSNWPVSDYAGPYSLIVQIVTEFFNDKGFQAKKKFFAANAQSAYRWRIRD